MSNRNKEPRDLSKWTCEDQELTKREGACRNPFGCHCREITGLVRRVAELELRLKNAENSSEKPVTNHHPSTDRVPEEVLCPTCGAKPGQGCVTRTGCGTAPHIPRWAKIGIPNPTPEDRFRAYSWFRDRVRERKSNMAAEARE